MEFFDFQGGDEDEEYEEVEEEYYDTDKDMMKLEEDDTRGQANVGDFEIVKSKTGSLGWINIAKSNMDGILNGLQSLYGIKPSEPPRLKKEDCSGPFHLSSDKTAYVTMIKVKHPGTSGSGIVIVRCPKEAVKRMADAAESSKRQAAANLEKVSRDLCQHLAEVLKAELLTLKMGDVELSAPQSFAEGIEADLADVRIAGRYVYDIYHQSLALMSIEIGFKGGDK